MGGGVHKFFFSASASVSNVVAIDPPLKHRITMSMSRFAGAAGMQVQGEPLQAYDPANPTRPVVTVGTHSYYSFPVVNKLIPRDCYNRNEVAVPTLVADHRNIEPVLFEDMYHPQYVSLLSQFADRGSLVELFKRDASYRTILRAVPLLLQCARGVAAVHAVECIHGDIKPANFLAHSAASAWFGVDVRVTLTDFGHSHLLGPLGDFTCERQFGTPGFQAPEVLQVGSSVGGSSVGTPSDVYSFGCMAREVLRFVCSSQRPMPPVEVEVLCRVWQQVQRCMAPAPAARPSMHEVSEALQRILREASDAGGGTEPHVRGGGLLGGSTAAAAAEGTLPTLGDRDGGGDGGGGDTGSNAVCVAADAAPAPAVAAAPPPPPSPLAGARAPAPPARRPAKRPSLPLDAASALPSPRHYPSVAAPAPCEAAHGAGASAPDAQSPARKGLRLRR